MYQVIDGKKISQEIKDELREKAARMREQGIERTLAVIQVGADPASSVYVRNKKKACEYVGIRSLSYELPEETGEEELLGIIRELNEREDVNGILVQLPLPSHIDEERVLLATQKHRLGSHPPHTGPLPFPGARTPVKPLSVSFSPAGR